MSSQKSDKNITLVGTKEEYNPCEYCYGCEFCNDCQRCFTCQDMVDNIGAGFQGFDPPDIEDFVRIDRKEDGHLWLTLPQWLERILRKLFGWWFKPPPKK